MQALGLKPGTWVRQLKDSSVQQETIVIDGKEHNLEMLRTELLSTTKGDSIAYCTDFLLDDAAREVLVPALRGVRLLLCECQYLHYDLELAVRNYHMTAQQVALLAKEAGVQELVLFHVSDRYDAAQREQLLREARAIFPNTYFPKHW